MIHPVCSVEYLELVNVPIIRWEETWHGWGPFLCSCDTDPLFSAYLEMQDCRSILAELWECASTLMSGASLARVLNGQFVEEHLSRFFTVQVFPEINGVSPVTMRFLLPIHG